MQHTVCGHKGNDVGCFLISCGSPGIKIMAFLERRLIVSLEYVPDKLFIIALRELHVADMHAQQMKEIVSI
jgi:hypothetical protein